MIGCLMAIGWKKSQRFRITLGSLLASPAPLLALAWIPATGLGRHYLETNWNYSIGYLGDSLAIAILLAWAVTERGSISRSLLGSKAMVHLGTISYSLYLWQQPFMWPGIDGWLSNPAIRLAAILVAAELSYRLVEIPFLRLKDKTSDHAPEITTETARSAREIS